MDEPSVEVLQFPCDFPIRVIGLNTLDYDEVIIAILLKHVPGLDVEAVSVRLSSGGNYRSLSSQFVADSRAQLDALYIELTAHPYVKWVL